MAKQTRREQNQIYRKKMAALGAWHRDLHGRDVLHSYLIAVIIILGVGSVVHHVKEDRATKQERILDNVVLGMGVGAFALTILFAMTSYWNQYRRYDAMKLLVAERLKEYGLTEKDLEDIRKTVGPLHLEQLSEIDPDYINGIIMAKLDKNGKIGISAEMAIRDVVTGYLISHPGDYDKIVGALQAKNPSVFSEQNLAGIKFDADFNLAIRKKDAEFQTRKSAKLAALKTAKIKRMFGIKSKAK